MGRTALFIDDCLTHKDSVSHVSADGESASGPLSNALNDRPRSFWLTSANYFFMIDGGMWMDINEGSGEVSVKLSHDVGGGIIIAQKLQNNLNASAVTSLTYTVVWTGAKFQISAVNGAGAATNFAMLFDSGSHGASQPRSMLGFQDADYSGSSSYTAAYQRHGTDFFAVFETPATTTGAVSQFSDVFALALDAGPKAAINLATPLPTDTSSTVKMYSHSSIPSLTDRAAWESSATAYTFSTRNPEGPYKSGFANRIQVAHASAGATVTARYYAFSWRYFDEEPYHAVGLIKALKKKASATRQIAQLQGHGLLDPSVPLGINSYFPVQQLLRWKVNLNFDSWEASDFRDVVHDVVLEGKAKGLLWALRWDKIADGTYDPEDEAARGFLFWGAITEYSTDDYSGFASDYISAELTVEQVR
jgi:hypothetical protein